MDSASLINLRLATTVKRGPPQAALFLVVCRNNNQGILLLIASFRVRQWLALLAAGVLAGPIFASQWVEVGTSGVSTDKVMVDADSIQKIDEFKVADIMTVYAAPRTNVHNFTLDRHVQKTAFNCAKRSFIGIQTFGYLDGKQVASSPEAADWRIKLIPMNGDPMSKRIYTLVCAANATPGTPAQSKPTGSTGSGIIVDDTGDVLTNNHVVKNCKSITVKAIGSDALTATVNAVDPKNDLAILRTAYGESIGTPARFRSQSKPARLGEEIGVIGYPLTGFLSAEPKATFGQISSVAGYNNDYTLLQISAPVQPGNSGGPVLDASGLVIGVVVSQASLALASIVGNVPQNVNFAIRGELTQIFLAARGIKVATSARQQTMPTEAIAAAGQKSTVFVVCKFQ
jgi:S1-C subfamily serine protease